MTFMSGPNVGIQNDINRFYRSHVEPLLSYRFPGNFKRDQGLALFKTAYSLVTSRSFVVDNWLKLAWYPLQTCANRFLSNPDVLMTDVRFNHVEDNGICLHTEQEVCPLCGALSVCEHDSPPSSPTSMDFEPVDTADMVTSRDHEADEEIFNSYSYSAPLSNLQLLFQYGFMEDGNNSDRVSFTIEELREVAGPDLGNRVITECYLDSEGDPSEKLIKTLQGVLSSGIPGETVAGELYILGT